MNRGLEQNTFGCPTESNTAQHSAMRYSTLQHTAIPLINILIGFSGIRIMIFALIIEAIINSPLIWGSCDSAYCNTLETKNSRSVCKI